MIGEIVKYSVNGVETEDQLCFGIAIEKISHSYYRVWTFKAPAGWGNFTPRNFVILGEQLSLVKAGD